MIALTQMGSFFVGGRRVRFVDQPLRPCGGLTGVQWERTPDVRGGLTRFLEVGVVCYVTDKCRARPRRFALSTVGGPTGRCAGPTRAVEAISPRLHRPQELWRSTIFQRRQFAGGQAQGHCRRTR
jgi:hypothetical protein